MSKTLRFYGVPHPVSKVKTELKIDLSDGPTEMVRLTMFDTWDCTVLECPPEALGRLCGEILDRLGTRHQPIKAPVSEKG